MSKMIEFTINIPIDLYERLSVQASREGFSSVDQYTRTLLVEMVPGPKNNRLGESTHTLNEEEQIAERLRALGYIE